MLFSAFCAEHNIFFVEDGKAVRNKRAMWQFYRDLKKLELAFAMAAGQASLSGVGRFKVGFTNRYGRSRPQYRFSPSAMFSDWMLTNHIDIAKSPVVDSKVVSGRALKIYRKLQGLGGVRRDRVVVQDEESDSGG
jgi:hypothetical protein